MNMHLRLQLPVEQWCLLWVPAGRPIHFSTRKKPMISWKSILREGWTVLHWTHFWWFKVLTSGVSMWSFRGPTLGWALTLFYNTSPRFPVGNAFCWWYCWFSCSNCWLYCWVKAISWQKPAMDQKIGRILDWYPWHCHCDIMKIEFNSDFFGFISHHIDKIDRHPRSQTEFLLSLWRPPNARLFLPCPNVHGGLSIHTL